MLMTGLLHRQPLQLALPRHSDHTDHSENLSRVLRRTQTGPLLGPKKEPQGCDDFCMMEHDRAVGSQRSVCALPSRSIATNFSEK